MYPFDCSYVPAVPSQAELDASHLGPGLHRGDGLAGARRTGAGRYPGRNAGTLVALLGRDYSSL